MGNGEVSAPRKRRPGGGRKKGLTLRPTDYAVLKAIAETGFQTTQEIRSGGFQGMHRVSALQRLQRLARAGYLQEKRGDGETILGWTLSAKRAHEVFVNYQEVLENVARVPNYRTPYFHDKALRDIRISLMKSPGIVRWIPEHVLKAEVMRNFSYLHRREQSEKLLLIPDALLHLESDGEQSKAALELELTRKKHRRLHDKMEAYILSPDFDYAFFIAQDERLLNYLKGVHQDVVAQSTRVKFAKQQNGIYFCTLDEIQKLGVHATFVSATDKLRFADLGN